MKYALFLGCTVPVRAQNYELAARRVAQVLGIELADVEDFACCGFPIKSTSLDTALLTAARNLAVAEEKGFDICTLCSSCTGTLTEANERLRSDLVLRDWANSHLSQIGRKYTGTVRVKHFVRVLYEDVGIDNIKEKVVKELKRLKLAAHPGCHYVKPSEVYEGFDEVEYPKTLDELLAATGAEYLDYEEKKLCCGGAILGVDEEIALTMAKKKLDSVAGVQADGLISICPFCSIMFESHQRKIESKYETKYALPVLYYPQILGLALGIEQGELGFKLNRVKPDALLEKVS